MKYNIKVTTTSNFEGYNIKKYFDTISDHVVVGSNVISDSIASFTDFFGGYSNTYQKKISLIKYKALQNLKQSANYLGANAIIGLTIDIDEISSKSKSMFMVTVMGTPVVIEIDPNSTNSISQNNDQEFSGDEINILVDKNKIKTQIETKPQTFLTDEQWEFIIEYKFWEICEPLILCAVQWESSIEVSNNKIVEYVKLYLSNLNKEHITRLLYSLYLDEKYKTFHKLIYEIIKDKELCDLEKLIELTKLKNENLKYNILNLITVRKESSKLNDINNYRTLLSQIEKNYVEVISYSKQKKIFSSIEDDIWICTCSNKNSIDLTYCSKCSHDKFGFKQYSINPQQAIEWLEETINALMFLEKNSRF